MATFKKTLTMSLINSDLDSNALSDDEVAITADVLEGTKGYLLKTTWNSTPCWNNVNLGKSIVTNTPLYLSASINVDDTSPNQLIHAATPFYSAQASRTPTIEDVSSNAISFTQSIKCTLQHNGDDLWTATFTIDLRNLSETLWNTNQDLYGKERTIVTFMDEVLIEDEINYAQIYQGTKNFTWDKISTLTFTMQNKTIPDGTSDEIITYSIS